MYKLIIRPILFWFDPEEVHYFTFSLIRFISKIPGFTWLFKSLYLINDKRLEREVFGLKFKNPVGLAAGFDKDAKLFQELSNFGFGFIEIGTLTPIGQEGNPKKRLFRLKEDSAIINRMGFNNGGVQEAVERLKKNKNVLSSDFPYSISSSIGVFNASQINFNVFPLGSFSSFSILCIVLKLIFASSESSS